MTMSPTITAPPGADTRAVVEAAYAALAARDVDALIALLAEDVEWGGPDNPLIPAAGTRTGIAGVREWLRIGSQTEDILALEPRRILVDGDMAAVTGTTRIRARTTHVVYETDFVHLLTVVDGRVTRFRELFDTWVAAEAFRE